MSGSQGEGRFHPDALDRGIVHCLGCHPRVPFSRVAGLLDVSEQTVARRYRRMRAQGVLRVVAQVDPTRFGQVSWTARLTVRPDGATALAEALAWREDVSWVTVSSGGTEVTASLRLRSEDDRDDLLLSRLPRQAPVLGVRMAAVLHRFTPPGRADWVLPSELVGAQDTDALCAERPDRRGRPGPAHEPRTQDAPLLTALAVDGRASLASLASSTGWSEGQVARRLEQLLSSGAAYLDLDAVLEPFGLGSSAMLWLSVEPASLDAAGRALAAHPQVVFAAAFTGSSNLGAMVLSPDLPSVYALLTTAVGALSGVRDVEVAPTLRTIKHAGTVVRGDRLMGAAAAR